MNKLLSRQILKIWGGTENIPEAWRPLLKVISETYDHHDRDRSMLERSIELSSDEMMELYDRLRIESKELAKAHGELKRLFDTMETVFFTVDMTTYQLVQMSPSCEKIYGYTHHDFLNNSELWFQVVPEEDKPVIEKNYELMYAGKSFSHVHRIIAKDGTVRWVESKITPTLGPEMELLRIDGVTTDVTAQKEAEELTRQSELRFKMLIEKSRDGISLLDRDGRLIYTSPSVERILGYTPEELIGTDPIDVTHPEDLLELLPLLGRLMAQPGESRRAQYRVKNKSGEWKWISSTITNLLHEKSINAVVFNYQDVTKHKQIQDQLEFDRRNRDALINSTSDLIWSFDTSKRLISANNSFLQAMKAASGIDLLPGGDLLDPTVFPESVLDKWRVLYDRVLSGESFVHENYEEIPQDQWAELAFNPIEENGKIIGGSCSWRDITDKKKQNERIIASEQMMSEAQRISRFGSWELKFDRGEQVEAGSIVWSKEVYRIFGLDPEVHTPDFQNVLERVHPDDVKLTLAWLDNVANDEQSEPLECRIIATDDSVRWVRTSADLIRDKTTGAKIKLLGTSQDITERKSLELERAEAIEDLLQRNKDLEQFAHIVSHNLRAPVANIIGLTHLLRLSENDLQTRDQCTSGLAIAAQRLDDIIKDLNKILQVKRGMTEDKTVVDFGVLVQNIADSIQMQIEQAEVTINTDFSEIAEMYTIKNYLHSVFYNLISNSIKYRRPLVKPVIKISSSRNEDGKTILTFTDNCMGIDLEKHRDHVFGLYKRFHHDIEGKGLGMYMVKTQVESLGGKIAIDSKVNEGTEIRIEFATAS